MLPTLAPLWLFQSTDCCIQGLSPGGGIYFLLTRVPASCARCIFARHPPNTPQRLLAARCSDCKIGANESSEASATPEDSTVMVKWVVGDSVDYEVNGTWYPGYIARSDSSTLYFKYDASQYKGYEEPIKKASRDDLARLRAGSGSGPPAAAKKKKPAARKPAAKSPAKKKTVAKPAARKPAAKPAAKKSCEPGVHDGASTASTGPRRRPAKKPAAKAKSPSKKPTAKKSKKSPARKKK